MLADSRQPAAEIQKEAASRLDKTRPTAISTKLAIIHFEVPAAEKPKKKAKAKK